MSLKWLGLLYYLKIYNGEDRLVIKYIGESKCICKIVYWLAFCTFLITVTVNSGHVVVCFISYNFDTTEKFTSAFDPRN